MYILVTGRPHIEGNNTKEMFMNIKNLKNIDFSSLNYKLSSYGLDFLNKML